MAVHAQHDVVGLTAVQALVEGLGLSDEELAEEAAHDAERDPSEVIPVLTARRELELREPSQALADDLLVDDLDRLREMRDLLWDERQLVLYGPPGTGKTVVALHRVKHLLSRSADSRILLTTFTNALAESLRENLAFLLDDDRDLLGRVDITTVDAFANGVVTRHDGRAPAPLGDREVRRLWGKVIKKLDLPWTEQFLEQEYRHVVLGQDLRSEDAYLAAQRRGRGSALSPSRRARLWSAVEHFESLLRDQGATTHLRVCARAADLLAASGPTRRHVVVDEAQDLHPAQWRVLRAAAAPDTDDLFLCGDPHQRIYDAKVSLSSLGMKVTGRSHRLRVNHRSTEEILVWSTGILAPVTVDDLGGDGTDSLAGYCSLLHGRRPHHGGYDSEAAEVTALVDRVQEWIAQGVRPAEIGVCARFNLLLDKVKDKLEAVGVPVVRVKDRPGPGTEGVRLATMHAMKGLEFRCVAVLGATATSLPFASALTPADVDPLQHESDLLRERCLLFVACTRARESLSVTWSGAASPFVPA